MRSACLIFSGGHPESVVHDGEGHPVPHTRAFVSRLFDEELRRLVDELPQGRDRGDAATLEWHSLTA